ncbi:MAG: leucyl aminopeptidase family protein [Alphaproteobacteria bacterium]|nr:leucyl aminopeptidase family protein [Alphaproteobacteria bacterium]MBU1281724.1 leucyl aminopeptidase family protein [Alphaproteobacteria bacterium]MBU1572956.1 leucyl aminopeptidase family protein [Alphaproteobacteria bacterium]MBU1828558.1 leucyl aminopeptidase family protein [Alphaproteobacteria bacterium]MBU2077836.1 leucyl aminopeptidase family protein [Alphaproteobacteria bacterium]
MPLSFVSPTESAVPVFLIGADDLDAFLATRSDDDKLWLKANGFSAALGTVCVIPAGGKIAAVVAGFGIKKTRARDRFGFGAVRSKLPDGTYALHTVLTGEALEEQLLAWLLSGYAFDTYAKKPKSSVHLVAPEGVDIARLEAIAAGEALTRDLINTPSNDMGPAELEQAARSLAQAHGAEISVTVGEGLLEQNFPMIHAVGRASPRAPALIDMRWGEAGPTLTLVGKGVCFDTGGLNLKPGASMGLMKKDMGGAATVLGLAKMIMALNLPLRLRVLIPAVENAVSGNAFRPQDVLTSRKGLTVEINNTDAEGRLVLADALALADETPPDLLISMATLTGAARVAVGPDLAPFFATDPKDALVLSAAAAKVADPVWQLPYWEPYESMIEPGIADLDNAPSGGMAGSITAALFLRRFVTETPRYMHFDIYGWNPTAAPARPKGGVGQGARALLAALPELLPL